MADNNTKPILFSGEMVRAILAGTKTMTRRVVKPQPDADHGGEPYWHIGGYRAWTFRNVDDVLRSGAWNHLVCPYGKPGDRLWVRETFAVSDAAVSFSGTDGYPVGTPVSFRAFRADMPDGKAPTGMKWKPSIFMPRATSRITLEITGVRVERLNDISEEDAIAEGVKPVTMPSWRVRNTRAVLVTAREEFETLWDKINGKKHPWASNPFVWCISFRRIDDGR